MKVNRVNLGDVNKDDENADIRLIASDKQAYLV